MPIKVKVFDSFNKFYKSFGEDSSILRIYTCSSIHFRGRSKCGSHLSMLIYKIQENLDAMAVYLVRLGKFFILLYQFVVGD